MAKHLPEQDAGRSRIVQVELYPITRVDQGGGSNIEALPNEIWRGQVGPDPGDRAAAWEAHTAAERPGSTPAWPAILSRYGPAYSRITSMGLPEGYIGLACQVLGKQVPP